MLLFICSTFMSCISFGTFCPTWQCSCQAGKGCLDIVHQFLYRLPLWGLHFTDLRQQRHVTFAKLDLQVCADLCRQIPFAAKLTRMKENKSMKCIRQNRLSSSDRHRCNHLISRYAPPTFTEDRWNKKNPQPAANVPSLCSAETNTRIQQSS